MRSIVSALAALVISTVAASADDIVDATLPDRLLPIFAKFGSVEIIADDAGDPLIRGAINGTTYLVFFYGCTDNAACKNLTFTASWDVDGISATAINDWNRNKRFGKAFLDGDNDPAIQMTVNLDYGVTATNFEDTVDWWRVVLGQFRDEVLEP